MAAAGLKKLSSGGGEEGEEGEEGEKKMMMQQPADAATS